MIVTCESCKSRYKLDDARITGRGAKITCPRCKTVFVVYARDTVTAAAAAVAASSSIDEDDDDEPTGNGAHPGPAQAMVGPAVSTYEVNVAAAPPADMAARAAALDFKQVGVSTWKVKVKIGLIYDFSDLRTLRKYITDGRVTPSDVISHDGKSWRQIGEIPDLDVYFVETFEKLASAHKDAPPPPPPKKTPPPAELDLKKAEAEATRFTDPFEEQRRKAEAKGGRKTSPASTSRGKDRKEAAGAKPSEPASNSGALLAAAAIVLALAGGAWFMTRAPTPAASVPQKSSPAQPTSPQTQAETPPPPEANPTIQQISSDLAAVQDRAPSLPSDEPTTPTLIPVRRDGGPVPDGARPVRPKDGGAATSGSAMKTSAASASDHEQAGDAEASSGNWSGAASAYRKAVALDGKNANLQFKLGQALYRAKDDNASTPLESAARLGRTDAYRLLGDIAAEQGDIPGAMSRYQQYLKTKPKDAAEIERRMRELSGSGG